MIPGFRRAQQVGWSFAIGWIQSEHFVPSVLRVRPHSSVLGLNIDTTESSGDPFGIGCTAVGEGFK